MPRTDARAVIARLRELDPNGIIGADGSGDEPRVRSWLNAVDALGRDLAYDGVALPAALTARAAAARAWLDVRAPAERGDHDWCVWRYAHEAVFRLPGARLFVDPDGVRLVLGDAEAVRIRARGPLTDARVDVPTGRGLRTGRARKPDVRVELKGTRLTVHGPAELLVATSAVRVAPGTPPIDVEW